MEVTTHKFYIVTSVQGKEWVRELQAISARRAKKCDSCDATGGVFFRCCGPDWLLADRLIVEHRGDPITQCWSCWVANDGPAFYINKNGETIQNSYRATIMFAKDRTELVWLVKRWNNGQKLMRKVRTPYGDDVVVFAKEDDVPGEDYLLKCPHCRKSIVLTAATY